MDGHSVVDLLLKHEQEDAESIYLRQPRHGQWFEFTWSEVMDRARRVATFLINKGLKRGTHISIYSKNCAEWFIVDYGITLAGMVNVPLFPNQHQESIDYVLHHAEVQLVFIGKLDNHIEAIRAVPSDIKTANFDYHLDIEADYQWSDVMASKPFDKVAMPNPEDTYTIIYSSGTSGNPKGAVYTHEAITNYLGIYRKDIERLAVLDHYRLLSYLPLAHVYERSAIQLGSLAIPCTVSFVQSLDVFADNLREVEPSLFAAVPRIWGVFQSKIEGKVGALLLSILLRTPIISKRIKYKIASQLGLDKCYANISGAAHLPISILTFFNKLDLPIQEGYGQTENFAYATLAMKNEIKPGYVGSPRLGVEIKKGDHGELIMKSLCLMKEYYKEKQATDGAFTEEGWLRTGDIVDIDSMQRVKILGRLFETFKNQKGEFVTPAPIEKQFLNNECIEEVCLIGEELPSNIMLVSLTDEAKSKSKADITKKLQKTLKKVNPLLKSYEKISHVLVVKDKWMPENNLLTPTLKVKRREVKARYHDFINKITKDADKINWQ
jgi:long-chain acyl-CoA synthetase